MPPLEADYEQEIAEWPTWVLERDGQIVGGLTMDFGEKASISNVFLDPEAQGMGLGRRLMEFAEAEAAHRGFDALHLATHVLFTENLAAYRHLGWKETGRDETRVFMAKVLAAPPSMVRSKTRTMARWLLGAFLSLAGLAHLTWSREEFLAQVPTWLPMDGDLVVVLSGIVEILLGLALVALPRHRVLMGWVTAAFFVAVFPGNVSQYVNRIDAFGLDSDLSRGIRLLFQPVLVIWALWSTGAWRAWRSKAGPD